MNGVDIAIIVIVCVAAAAAIGYLIYRKVKHKGGCDRGCQGCSGCSACDKKQDNK